jgi:hypothetical protein
MPHQKTVNGWERDPFLMIEEEEEECVFPREQQNKGQQ